MLSLPLPLGLLLAAQRKLVTPVLRAVLRVISRQLLGQARLKGDKAEGERGDDPLWRYLGTHQPTA